MKNGIHMKKIVVCIGIALAQFEAGSALADSAVGVDTALGNALNPPGRTSVPREVDPDGVDTVRRSPTGQLYGVPAIPPTQSQSKSGWNYNGGIEAGVLGVGDEGKDNNAKAAQFRQYKDLKSGLYLNYFEAEADKPDAARFFQVFGGGTGQGDQFYGVQFGRYNDWKLKTFYNETTHVFADTWKSLYSGEGSGTLNTGLTMPTRVITGSPTAGTGACTAALPCWSYGAVIYSNATSLAAINGTTGTPNATTGVIATSTGIGATGAAQSNMAKAISDKLKNTPYSELSLVRKKGGVRGDITLTNRWKGFASYNLEKRNGSRPFAMNDGNVSTEIAEPIDYNTHDFLVGLAYNDPLNQANLRASASMFRNNISTLNVQYALLGVATSNGVIQHATFDLPPDNEAYNVKGEFARNLPNLYKGRFTASAAYGTNRQNDALLAPISAAQNADLAAAGVTTLTNANPGYPANTALVSNWNTVAALSQSTGNQRIDTKLLDLGLSIEPKDALSMKGSYRYYETDNKGGYIAYNPLTGQFGRGPGTGNGTGAFDTAVGIGSSASCYTLPGYPAVPGCSAAAPVSGVNVPVFGQARSTKQTNYGITADYDLTRTSSLNGAVEREEFNRNFRERAKTWEDKVKLGYVNRALGNSTLRVSYENDNKRGGEYRYRTFEDLGTGLPGLDVATLVANAGLTVGGVTYPALNANFFNRYSFYMRKYDQADRNQEILNTRLNLLAREDLDIGINLQLKRANFPNSFYGLKKDNQDSAGLEFNYQPSSERTITAFYNYQDATKAMQLNSGVAGAAACTASNIALYGYAACSDTTTGLDGSRPFTDIWTSETKDINNTLGLGLQNDFGFVRLGIDYSYSESSTHINYNFGSTAFSATPANNTAMALLAGSALPDMTTLQNTITLNLVKPINKKSSVRLLYRYEEMKIKDWHYDGVITGAMAAYDGNTLLLDAGPQNYHVSVVGLLYQLKF
jgi:hypothetical protein